MPRVSVYIDGGPFLDGVRGQGMSMDMDFQSVIRELLPDSDIGNIHYFTSVLPETPYPVKYKNQFILFDLLQAQGLTVHKSRTQIFGSIFVDRGTEAAIASQMITDAYEDRFDRALLISKREDLATPIAAIRKLGKAVDVAFFTYALDPANPLHADCDGKIDIKSSMILRHTRCGPRPILQAG